MFRVGCAYFGPVSPFRTCFEFLAPSAQITLYPLPGAAQTSPQPVFLWVEYKTKVSSRDSCLMGMDWAETCEPGCPQTAHMLYLAGWDIACGGRWWRSAGGQESLTVFPVWNQRNSRILRLIWHVFMKLYCYSKSRECILCDSSLAWFITFEYLDSECVGLHLSSSLSLACVIGYKTEIINTCVPYRLIV